METPETTERPRLRQIDTILLVSISVTGYLLLVCAALDCRTAADRTQTVNHLRVFGMLLHIYHDSTDGFPSEHQSSTEGIAAGKPFSFYLVLLPYYECSSSSPFNYSPADLKRHRCPARHPYDPAMKPITDFGYQASTSEVNAVLDAPVNISLDEVRAANGAANTLILSVVRERPSDYRNPTLPFLWTDANHGTAGAEFARDSETIVTGQGLGSPYAVTPALYVDGHTTVIAKPRDDIYRFLWSYTDRTQFDAP